MNLFFKLLNKPIFSMSDLGEYYDNINSARTAVNRLVKSGMVKRIRNDMYTCVEGEDGMAVANRFQIGSCISDTSCISHHTAMEYYGITDQVIYDVYVSSETNFIDFEFEGYRYCRVLPTIPMGVNKPEFSGEVIVTDLERTVLDSIKDMDKISGIEEVITNVESVGRLQEEKLIQYLEQYDNQFLYQKAGYILSKNGNRHGLSDEFFGVCLDKIGRSKRYITKDINEGIYDSKWQLIIPYNNIFKNGDFLDANI